MPIFVRPKAGEIDAIFDWLDGGEQPTPDRYMYGMALLELWWQRAAPGLSFKVVHDAQDQLPAASTRTAIAAVAALQHDAPTRQWFAENIRNAVVHCAAGADAIAVVGDSVHFYQVKEIASNLGARLFDRLPEEQKLAFTAATAKVDARGAFTAFIESIAAARSGEDSVRRLVEQIRGLCDAEQFALLVARAVEAKRGNGEPTNGEDWSDDLNARRIELIDRDIQQTITPAERIELADLQRRAIAHRDRTAPLPLEGARRLHKSLLEKQRRHQGRG